MTNSRNRSERGRPEILTQLATRLGVPIDLELLNQALTHRSYAYEQGGLPHNERLEFLGMRSLGYW